MNEKEIQAAIEEMTAPQIAKPLTTTSSNIFKELEFERGQERIRKTSERFVDLFTQQVPVDDLLDHVEGQKLSLPARKMLFSPILESWKKSCLRIIRESVEKAKKGNFELSPEEEEKRKKALTDVRDALLSKVRPEHRKKMKEQMDRISEAPETSESKSTAERVEELLYKSLGVAEKKLRGILKIADN